MRNVNFRFSVFANRRKIEKKMAAFLSFDNRVFSHFAFYASASVLKMLAVGLWTTRHRLGSNVFANEEDCVAFGKEERGEKVKPITGHQDVERVRRCHLNDLENIVPFVLLGTMYTLTEPEEWWALLHFRLFLASRVLHTICYLTPIPQPSRFLMFGVGMFVNISMGIAVLRAGSF